VGRRTVAEQQHLLVRVEVANAARIVVVVEQPREVLILRGYTLRKRSDD
jgi:hypothetical protein